MSLRTPLCQRLSIEKPVFLAGMGGVAYADVCAAVSEAGGFGTLGMATASPEGIRAEMRAVRARTDRPFGVDLLAALPATVDAAIDIIVEEGAAAFIAGLGVPSSVVAKCHDAGLLVMSMCGKVSHAVRAAEAGCDVVVAQGTEAGGHTGKVAGLALIPQIVDAVDIPVLAAGSIVDGRGLAASLALGCAGQGVAAHQALAVHGDPEGQELAGAVAEVLAQIVGDLEHEGAGLVGLGHDAGDTQRVVGALHGQPTRPARRAIVASASAITSSTISAQLLMSRMAPAP